MHTLFWKTRNCINGSQLTAALRRCKGPHSNLPRSCRTFRSNAGNYSKDPANSRLSSLSAVSDWIKKCWDHDKNLPAFAVNGDKITILTKPQDFYQTLKVRIHNCFYNVDFFVFPGIFVFPVFEYFWLYFSFQWMIIFIPLNFSVEGIKSPA